MKRLSLSGFTTKEKSSAINNYLTCTSQDGSWQVQFLRGVAIICAVVVCAAVVCEADE